jgi:gamma-glutamyl:cysteine ligase YbdK (ATP-grasp superfamily)
LSRPLLIGPTIKASKRTILVCNKLFGKGHHKSNKANAFRHSLWNVLICQKTLKKSKNKEKSIIWSKKVADLYEKVTQNEILDELMDLHNNEAGRKYFLELYDKKEDEIIDFLMKKCEKAHKIAQKEDFDNHKNELVYLVP